MSLGGGDQSIIAGDRVEPVDAGQFSETSSRALAHQHGNEVDSLGNQGARNGEDRFLD